MNEKFIFSDAKYLNERKYKKKFLVLIIYVIFSIDLFILRFILILFLA